MMLKKQLLAGVLAVSAGFAGQAYAQTALTMWYHGAGNPAESAILANVVEEFNASQKEFSVEIVKFPQISYNDSVAAAALAGKLPDIIDVDGPIMPNWAWAGYLAPLDIPAETYAKFLPGPIGIWDGKVYSVGLWDAAVAIVTRKSVLDEYGIRIPTLDAPWTFEEFDGALTTIQAGGKFEYALDMGMAWKGEWYPYAFSPFLQSFGGDLVDRTTYKTAEGALNGEAAMKFGTWWQSLFTRKLVPGTTQDPADRDTGFLDGKYAMSWTGVWAVLKSVEKYGDDLLFLPAPDFGNGGKIGAASWQFAVSATSANKEGANAFIQFALGDKHLIAFSDGMGLIPPTPEAAAASVNYKAGGPMEAFYELSAKQAMLRPVTPGYPVQAKIFEKALTDIADGADVGATLDAAADEITADIEKNKGYGH